MATQNDKGNVIASQPSLRGGTTKQSASLKPKLRFKEFEGEWEQKRYGDIYSFYTTNSFSRDNLNYENGKVKNIHYGDIHTKFSMLFDISKEIVPFINEEIDLSRIKDENYCQEGDLVIADASEDYNDVGKTIELINLNNEKTLAGLHTFLARPNKHKMQIGFAGYLVQSWKVRKQVMTIAQGTKVLGIATGRLSKIKLDIPNLPEQQKIANFLTAVDTKLQQLTTKKETLAQYKKGVMQQLFSQQLRFKPDVIARTQDDAISPNETQFQDWEEKRLGEVSIITMGQSPDSKSYNENGEGVLLIQGNADIKHRVTKPRQWTNEPTKECEIGDLILTVRAPVGSVAKSIHNACIGRGVCSIKNKTNSEIEYLYQFLLSYEPKWIGLEQGSTFTAVSGKDVKTLKLKIPSLKEQQKIANYLSAIDLKIEAVQTQISKTQAFKKGLLQQMFV